MPSNTQDRAPALPGACTILDKALEDWAEGDAAKDRKIAELETALTDMRYMAFYDRLLVEHLAGCASLDAHQGVTRH